MALRLPRPNITSQRRNFSNRGRSIRRQDSFDLIQLAIHSLEGVTSDEDYSVDLLLLLKEGVVPIRLELLFGSSSAFVDKRECIVLLSCGEERVLEVVRNADLSNVRHTPIFQDEPDLRQ